MAKTNGKNNYRNVNSKKNGTVRRNSGAARKKNTNAKKRIVVDDVVKKEIISEIDATLVKKTKQEPEVSKDLTTSVPIKKNNSSKKKVDVVKEVTAKVPVNEIKKEINVEKESKIEKTFDIKTTNADREKEIVKEVTAKIPVKKISDAKKDSQNELSKEDIVAQRKERNRKKYQNQQKKYQEKSKEKKKVDVEEVIVEREVNEVEIDVVKKSYVEPTIDLVKKEKPEIENTQKIEEIKQREERKEKRKKEKKPINLTQTIVNIKDKGVDTINVVKDKTTDWNIPLGKTKDDKKVRFKRFIKEAILYSMLLTVINVVCIVTIDYFNFLRLFDVKWLNVVVTVILSLIFNFFIAFMVDYFVTEVWLKNRRKEDGEQHGDNWSFDKEYRKDIKDKKRK